MVLRIDDRIIAVALGVAFSVLNAFVYMYLALKVGMATGLDILLLFLAFFVFAATKNARPRAFLYMMAIMAMAIGAVLAYTDSLGSILMSGETLAVPGAVMSALISLSLIIGMLASAYFTRYFLQGGFPWPGPRVSVSIIGLLTERKGPEFRASAVRMGFAGTIAGAISGMRGFRLLPETIGTTAAGLSLSPFLAGIGMLVGVRGCLPIVGGAIGSLLVLYLAEGGSVDYLAHMRSPWIFSTAVAMMVASAGISLSVTARPVITAFLQRITNPVKERPEAAAGGIGRSVPIAHGLLLLAAVALSGALLTFFAGIPVLIFVLFIPVTVLLMIIETRGRAEMAMSVGIAAFVVILLAGLAFRDLVPLLLFQGFVLATTLGFASTLSLQIVAEHFHVDPKGMRYMLAIGAIAGGLICVPTITIINSLYGVGTDALPAPYSVMWLEMARSAVTKVLSPSIDPYFLLAGAVIAIGLYHLRISAISVALGLLLPVSATSAIFLGSLIGWALAKKGWLKDDAGIVASGLVAGDILVGLLFSIKTLL